MRVSVTQADIDAGRRSDPHRCAIAQALHRIGYPLAVVAYHTTTLDGISWGGPLPEQMRLFIRDFDAQRRVEPTEFDWNFEPLGTFDVACRALSMSV